MPSIRARSSATARRPPSSWRPARGPSSDAPPSSSASAHPKLHVEEVITRVVKWLFVIVGVLVAIAVAASLAQGLQLLDILPLSLVLLMSAVPVALPVMFTVSMAVGSMELARTRRAGHAAQRRRGRGQHGRALRRQDRHAHDEPAVASPGRCREPGFTRRRRAAPAARWRRTRRTRIRSTSRFLRAAEARKLRRWHGSESSRSRRSRRRPGGPKRVIEIGGRQDPGDEGRAATLSPKWPGSMPARSQALRGARERTRRDKGFRILAVARDAGEAARSSSSACRLLRRRAAP